MALIEQKGKSWNCKRCDFELVETQKNTIAEIIEELNPNFMGLPNNWLSMNFDWIKICPRCNNYPLGLDLEKGFPIRTQSGDITTIHDLPFVKAHKHTEYQQEILNSEKAWDQRLRFQPISSVKISATKPPGRTLAWRSYVKAAGIVP